MESTQEKYEGCWSFLEVQEIYNNTHILPTKETFVCMIQNNYDRFNVIKLFENQISIDTAIMNVIPKHRQYGDDCNKGYPTDRSIESVQILEYLYKKYNVKCNDDGLLNACLMCDVLSAKYIIEIMNIMPNKTHIEQCCSNATNRDIVKYLHTDLKIPISSKAIKIANERGNEDFADWLKRLSKK